MNSTTTFTRAAPTAFIPAESAGLGFTLTASTIGSVNLAFGGKWAVPLSAEDARALAQELLHIADKAQAAKAEYESLLTPPDQAGEGTE